MIGPKESPVNLRGRNINYSLHSQHTNNISVESRRPTIEMNTTNKFIAPQKARTRGISDYCCKFGLSGNETSRQKSVEYS